jgi:hypothetical protein
MEDLFDVSGVGAKLGKSVTKKLDNAVNQLLKQKRRGFKLLLQEADSTTQDESQNVPSASVVRITP